MKKTIYIIIILTFFSCNKNTEIVEGELFFKLVNPMPYKGLSEEKKKEIEKYLLTESKNQDEVYIFYKTLKENNILGNPSLDLKTKLGVKKVFLNQISYEKIKKYSLDKLREENKKIIINLNLKKINSHIYYSDEIISLKEIEGETEFQK